MTRRHQPAASAGPKPVIALTPGVRLRADIEAALQELRTISAGDRNAMRRVRDDLRGALAHSAAVGETSQLIAAVTAVRTAEKFLDASSPSQASAALSEALHSLPAPQV